MPDKKITDLAELTTAVSTDVLAIVDVAANVTKKIQVGNLPGGSGGGVTAVTGTAPITSSGGLLLTLVSLRLRLVLRVL